MTTLRCNDDTPAEIALSINDADDSPALQEGQGVAGFGDDSLEVAPLFAQTISDLVILLDLFPPVDLEGLFLLSKVAQFYIESFEVSRSLKLLAETATYDLPAPGCSRYSGTGRNTFPACTPG